MSLMFSFSMVCKEGRSVKCMLSTDENLHSEGWKREMHATLFEHAFYNFKIVLKKVSQNVNTFEKLISKVKKLMVFKGRVLKV